MTKPSKLSAEPKVANWQAFALAYLILGLVVAGDSLFAKEYLFITIPWLIWYGLSAFALAGAVHFLLKSNWKRVIRQIPIELSLLIAIMLGSAFWSSYPGQTLLSFLVQLSVIVFALFFAAVFSWRHILVIFSNSLRVIIFGSLGFELVTSLFKFLPESAVSGIDPTLLTAIHACGHLFDGRRIDGILLNANFVAAWALIGVITFIIEFVVIKRHRYLTSVSIVLSVLTIVLARSAGIVFASVAVVLAAIVSLLAEGKDRDTRHRYYRIAWIVSGSAGFLVLIFRRTVFEFLGKSPDMTHRSDIWRKVFSLISQRPLEGWGFTGVWPNGVMPYTGLVVINGTEYFQAHNAYLDIWLQIGLVGLVLTLILLTRTFVKTWRLGVHHSNALYLWPLLTFIVQLIRGITESRLLIQSAMLMLILFTVKSYDPEEMLEENSRKPKLNSLRQAPVTKLKRR